MRRDAARCSEGRRGSVHLARETWRVRGLWPGRFGQAWSSTEPRRVSVYTHGKYAQHDKTPNGCAPRLWFHSRVQYRLL